MLVFVDSRCRRQSSHSRRRTVWRTVDMMYCSLGAVEYAFDSNRDDFDVDNSIDAAAADAALAAWHFRDGVSSISANRAP